MLLARAFVLSLSPRAFLAVAALALSVAFALVAAGALTTLQPEGATLEEARQNPGSVHYQASDDPEQPFASFNTADAPSPALFVDWSDHEGVRVAAIDARAVDPVDYPALPPPDAVLVGTHADAQQAEDLTQSWGLPQAERANPMEYAPRDALLIPLGDYQQHFGDRDGQARLAYSATNTASPGGASFSQTSWQGIDAFFASGARELTTGFIAVVTSAGVIAALLASGVISLEVLARRRELSTIQALAGNRVARRLVALRTVALVAAGLALGILVALAALRLASAALDTRLTPDPLVWLAVSASVALGAALFGTIAGLRALERHTRKGQGTSAVPVRRFPGPIRFLTVSPRVFFATFSATLVTSAVLLTIVAVSAMPATLFTAEDDPRQSYLSGGGGNVLRGNVDRFLGENAHLLEEVESSMGETYAPTVHDERALMVRGTDHERWRAHMDVQLSDGRWPQADHEATIGQHASDVRDIAIGDRLVLPSSYHHGAESVLVVGIHEAGGLWDDELVPTSEQAGRLAGLPPDRVTGIRLTFQDADHDWERIRPEGVVVTELQLDPDDPVPLTPLTVTLTLVNFDPVAHTHPVAVYANDELIESARIEVPGHQRVEHTFTSMAPDSDIIQIRTNPTETRPARGATLFLQLPDVARPGTPFNVNVTDANGQPVNDVTLLIDGEPREETDTNGRASLQVDEAGLVNIAGRRDDDHVGALLRVAPADWDDEARIQVERIHEQTPRSHNETHMRIPLEATVANLGGQTHNATINWTAPHDTTETVVDLAPGTRTTLQASLRLPEGNHTLRLADTEHQITVTLQEDPRRVSPTRAEQAGSIEEAIAIKRDAVRDAEPRPGDPGDAFLESVFRRVEGATSLILLATLIHGAALLWVGMVREARERETIPLLLRQLGATQDQVRTRSVRDATLAAVPGIVLGLTAAWLVLAVSRSYGFPAAFGHTLPIADNPGFFLRTGIVLLAITVLATLWATMTARAHSAPNRTRRPLPELIADPRDPRTHASATPATPRDHTLARRPPP